MNKKVKKKRFNFKRFFIFLLFLVCIILSYIFLSKIKVKNILVINNKYVTDEQIIEAASLDNYPSFIKYNITKGKKSIKKITQIKDVSIKRKWGFKIVINVEEHQVLFKERSTGDYITSDGTNLKESISEVPTLINFVSDDVKNKMIDKFSIINDDVLSKISEIEYAPNEYDTERFVFYMNDSNMVYVSLNKIKEFNKYNKIKDQIGTNKGILYLDSGNYFEIKE